MSHSSGGGDEAAAAALASAGLDAHASSMRSYKIVNTIGRGNFGVCHLAECIDTNSPLYLGKLFVIKQINMSQLSASEKEGAVQEARLLSELHHPFIVGYRESFLEGEVLHIVMSYCEGGDLTTLIKNQDGKHFSEEQILDWFIQLCLALRYIHQRRIIHRDLKSQNVFLTKRLNVRLGDLGIARVLNGTNELAMSVVGTPYSMSPEVCENKPYSYKSDIWALGCVLYELCTLKHAFDAQNLLGLVWKIVSESYPPIPDFYSAPLHDLVASMLAKDPAKRPAIDNILELSFIRDRLHSQIKAKMMLKSKTKGEGSGSATGATGGNTSPSKPSSAQQQRSQPATARPSASGTATGATAAAASSFHPNSTSLHPSPSPSPSAPSNGRSHSASSVPLPSPSPPPPVASASGVALSCFVPPSPSSAGPNLGASNLGPTGTLRARPTPTLDVGDRSPLASVTPTAASSARAGSAHRVPLSSPQSASGRDNYYSAAPMLSPSEQLQKRKQMEADRRARELQDAARAGQSDRAYAQQRTVAEFRGSTAGGVPRPTTSQQQQQQQYQSHSPSYQSAFDDDGAQPARQRSAGSARGQHPQHLSNDGSASGRGGHMWPGTPSRGGAPSYDYGGGAYPSSPLPSTPSAAAAAAAASYEDRPIKSSGSYRIANSGSALSPAALQARSQAAQQAAQQQAMCASASPPSARMHSGSARGFGYGREEGEAFGHDHSSDLDLSQPGAGGGASRGSFSSSSHAPRPGSVSATSSSSRVTRVRDEDDDTDGGGDEGAGGDSYSDDEFDQYEQDEDDAVVHELERTYTATRISGPERSPRTLPQHERPVSSPNYHASAAPPAPVSRVVRPVSSVTPSSSSSASSSHGVGSVPSGSSAPTMGSKQEAVRARCLRVMSPDEFDEVCAFFRARKREGAAGLSKEELAAKFGTKNEQVVFQVEQYVYLSDLINDVQAMPKTTTTTTTATRPSGGGSAGKSSAGSGGSIKPPSTPSKSSLTPTKALPPGSASAARKVATSKPTSATSRTSTPTAAARAAVGSKKK